LSAEEVNKKRNAGLLQLLLRPSTLDALRYFFVELRKEGVRRSDFFSTLFDFVLQKIKTGELSIDDFKSVEALSEKIQIKKLGENK